MKKTLNIFLALFGLTGLSNNAAAQSIDPIQDILMCKYAKTDGDIVALTNYIHMYNAKTGDFNLNKELNYRRYADIFKSAMLFNEESPIVTFKRPHPVMVSWHEVPAGEADGGLFNTETKMSYDNLKKLVEKTNGITLKEYTSLIKKKNIVFYDYENEGLPPTKVAGYIAKNYGIYVFEFKNKAYVTCSFESASNLIN